MAVSRVRIYSGINPCESTVVGWGASLAGVSGKPEFISFMSDRGYEFEDHGYWPHNGSVSITHTEISPPLSEEHIKELGELCAKGEFCCIENGVIVTDNRTIRPNSNLLVNGNGLHIAHSW